MSGERRVVVGISGASGAALGIRVMALLAATPGIETHLIISPAGERVIAEEIGRDALRHVRSIASHLHSYADIGASIASGSFRTAGMVIAPCSIRTLSAVAYSDSGNLMARAADVHLKERRPLVLMVRESPLHAGHIRAMAHAAEAGAIIAPPVPPFYVKPESPALWIDQIARRALTFLELDDASLAPAEWHAARHTERRDAQ
jgi:4-hydroxy-3-polyprenylbenzoate decarboxylase